MNNPIGNAFDRLRKRIAINERGCWIWQGSLSKDMYGQIKVDGKSMSTHRVAYLALNGSIPRGKVIRHTCDDGRCCNPAHLLVGDHEDNNQDIVDRGRARARRVLTAEEVARVVSMRKAGTAKREIAEALQCNWYAVSAAIDSMGTDVKKSGRPKGSKNLTPRVSEDDKREICALYAQGRHTQQQLAERFGCDQTYVSLIVRGLK